MPPSWEYKRICNISTRLLLSSSSSYCWLLGKKQTKNQGIMQLEKKEIAKSTNQQTYGKPKTSSLDGWLNEWLHKLPGSKQSGPWVEHIRPPFVTARRSMSAKKKRYGKCWLPRVLLYPVMLASMQQKLRPFVKRQRVSSRGQNENQAKKENTLS